EGLVSFYVSRTKLVTARKQIGAATAEVQLHYVRGYRSGGLQGVARLKGVPASGDATGTPNGWGGLYKGLTSGPKIAVAFLWRFMCVGVWVVMIPGILLVLLLGRAARSRAGVKRFDELISTASKRRLIWGRDLEAARAALPPARQEAIAAAGFWGYAQVRDG